MAITFRDFFLGLSNALPQLANTYMAYVDYNYKNQMLQMEAAKTKSITGYYEAEKAATYSKINMDERKFNELFPLEVKTQEAVLRVQELAKMDAEGKHDFIMSKGGYTKFLGDEYDLNIDKIKAEINAASEAAATATEQRLTTKMQRDIGNASYILNTLNTMDFMSGSAGQGLFTKMIKETKIDPYDISAVLKYYADNGIETMPVETRKSMYNLIDSINSLLMNYNIDIDAKSQELMGMLLQPGDEGENVRKAYTDKTGIPNEETMKSVLLQYRKTRESMPFFQRLRIINATLTQQTGVPNIWGGMPAEEEQPIVPQTTEKGRITPFITGLNPMNIMKGQTKPSYQEMFERSPVPSPNLNLYEPSGAGLSRQQFEQKFSSPGIKLK